MVIRNQAINILWGSIVNKILENHKHYKSFYIVSNFAFPFGCEVLPTELYNGLENKKEYQYIIKPTTNMFGETVEEVYRITLSGVWTCHNIKNVAAWLTEMFGDRYFDLEFEV